MTGIITCVGKNQARIGYQFRFIGVIEECKKCKDGLRGICIEGLLKNHVYEVIEVRDINHECPIHKDGVTVVEVKFVPFEIAVKSNQAHEGSVIKIPIIRCEVQDCLLFKYCCPVEFEDTGKKKYKIMKVKERKKDICNKKLDLSIVEVESV